MNGRPDDRLLREVQEAIGLPSPALVEKDWHVVRALSAMGDVNADGMTLAFGGGTSLSRAYGLIERMSEDIDLRILGAEDKSRPALKRFRRAIRQALADAGFRMDDARQDVKHDDTYVRLDIPYDPIMTGEGVLRPEIKIELATFPVRRPPVEMPVRSFVAQAQDHAPEAPKIACVSIIDTAADKLVGLTRRAGEAYAISSELDQTLVRHVYDLHRLEGHYDPTEAADLVRQIMTDEAGRGYDAYAKDPLGETQATISRMAKDDAFLASYDRLLNDMVYGARPAFPDAWATVEAFARRIA